MADKNVYLYQTQSLHDRLSDSQRSLERTKTCIEGAFDRINLSVDVEIKSETPDPPQEEYRDVTGSAPCSSKCSSWGWLVGWFRDWLDCENLQSGHDKHDDVSVLISNTDETSGGASFPRCVHVQAGYHLSDLPASYENSGTGDPHAAMDTVLHELGHSFMEDTSTNYEHNSGNTDRTSSSSTKYETTPMGAIVGKDENECGNDHYYDKGPSTGTEDVNYRAIWSECCLDEWSPYAYQD